MRIKGIKGTSRKEKERGEREEERGRKEYGTWSDKRFTFCEYL